MKKTILICLLAFHLQAQEDTAISQEIQKTQSIDELNTQMQNAPRQYRHRYIQAIKERTRIENEAKREQLLFEISTKKSDDITTQQINALTGNRGNGNSNDGACNGSGNGNGSGGGKGGGGGGKGGR